MDVGNACYGMLFLFCEARLAPGCLPPTGIFSVTFSPIVAVDYQAHEIKRLCPVHMRRSKRKLVRCMSE